MNFTYFKFLFINTIKRKPVWITWLLFLFTCTCFIIIVPAAIKMNTLEVWANTTLAIAQTFMGMVAALFTAVLAINVFKDTNEEGTELIIISKPISRIKIVFTKFLLFGFFCLMINLSTVLLSVFTIFLPKTEPRFYVGLLVSMFIGNAVTFAVFGSISILLTVKFAKVGVIVANVIISLIFLIYQTLTLFVFATPAKLLDDNKMTAASYIIHQRDTTTGDYLEKEVVNFSPAEIEPGQEHPCQAKNWREMEEFWDTQIMAKDITPILNITDLAGQISLTYQSYNTNEFAHRQAQRMFAISRFYNYKLTSPASPELYKTEEIPGKENLLWLYTDYQEYPIEEGVSFYFPSSIGFEGIEPLSATRLRGFTDRIPIALIRSKELLSARDVFFEKEDWNRYKAGFDEMYEKIFDYQNYERPVGYNNYVDFPILFCLNTKNLDKYYQLVWGSLTGHASEVFDPSVETNLDNFDFNVKTVNDLNDRFMQFKHYVYWKILDEQRDILLNGKTYEREITTGVTEGSIKDQVYQDFKPSLSPLGIDYNPQSWLMYHTNTGYLGYSLLDPNTQAPSFDWILETLEREKTAITDAELDTEIQLDLLSKSTFARIQKEMKIFNYVCDVNEKYLFTDLDNYKRTTKYSGHAFMASDNWYPGIVTQFSPVPIGQNMQYFFYEAQPTVKYWIFAVIWGVISICLFTAGAIVYNKYDVK